MSAEGIDREFEHVLRDSAPQVLGALVRRCGDFAAAEDAVQEALLAALVEWRTAEMPRNPGGWLYRVAVRRLADRIDSEESRRRREALAHDVTQPDGAQLDASDLERDDTLELLFTCCHPALTAPSAIALTLRAVGGLTTSEIAGAFLVPDSTMAQRISRAKSTIQESGVPFGEPTPRERAQRLADVLHVLYLTFNEGYTSSAGPELVRVELATEAIRLTRALHRSVPDDAETAGLLALMLLTDARRAARTGPHGELIPLDEQDRSAWDRAAIEEGTALVTAAMSRGTIGAYQIQAAIAALHDEAPSAESTDWPQILALYGLLQRMSDNPMVALNHAVATAMVDGPRAGLERLDAIESDARLASTHRVAAVRAHLLERAGERDAAIGAFRAAADRATSIPERNFLLMKAARLAGTPPTDTGTQAASE